MRAATWAARTAGQLVCASDGSKDERWVAKRVGRRGVRSAENSVDLRAVKMAGLWAAGKVAQTVEQTADAMACERVDSWADSSAEKTVSRMVFERAGP